MTAQQEVLTHIEDSRSYLVKARISTEIEEYEQACGYLMAARASASKAEIWAKQITDAKEK